MTIITIPHPPIVSGNQWFAERKNLLGEEEKLTRQYDRVIWLHPPVANLGLSKALR
jgi:predicted dithiol-disulfide oxidoreductase (DUF899 family)